MVKLNFISQGYWKYILSFNAWEDLNKGQKQAGAELSQAQEKLGLTKPPLPGSTSIYFKIEVVLHLLSN